ncbi:MAG: hypothetical protein ACI9HK_002461 [Pirellulaceae bacterium]|jgi:hypothetical protein
MSNADRPVTELEQNEYTDLGVSSYDQVAGMLIALLFIVGFFTSLLFIIWLTHRLVFTKTVPPIVYIEEPMGRADNPEGYAEDMAEPGMEELPELEKPELQSTLEAVTDLVSTQMGAFDAISTSATQSGKGSGLGDKRKAGPGGHGDSDIIPRWERWQIKYKTNGLDIYAKQLDFFEIELGAAGGGYKQIDYAKNFTRGIAKRKGTSKQEKRLYMTWRDGTLQQLDRALLGKGGIPTKNRVVMQFYTKERENELATLELANAGGRTAKEFQKTIFGVREIGSGYEFWVMEQYYRRAR